MSIDETQTVMARYFEVMEAGDDFSTSYAEDVTLLLTESGQEVRGPAAVRDYILELHSKMRSQQQPQGLVVTDGHAYLEGDSVNAEGSDPGLSYCLVYDVDAELITAMRCYGSVIDLMAPEGEPDPARHRTV